MPELNYRFTFSHPFQETVVLEEHGINRCSARGLAWQALEAHLKTVGGDRDQYWKLLEQLLLGVVSNG